MGWLTRLFHRAGDSSVQNRQSIICSKSVKKAIEDLLDLYKHGDPYYDRRLQHLKDQCETLKKRTVTCSCGQDSRFGDVCHGWPGWIFRFECPKCGIEAGIRDPRSAR